ncbi:MAG: glycosyltransferase family 4 protein [Methylophilaceae bacterium]
MNKESKKFILIIFKHFPYGGAQRDLLQLAKKLCRKNFVEIVCMDWDGTLPKEKNISVKIIESNYFFNYQRYSEFKNKVSQYIQNQTNVISISFSKISGFDFYYAADSCFGSKNKNFFKNLSPRYQFFHKEEYQIFNPKSKTKILSISRKENEIYKSIYKTPDNKFIFIPPYIDKKFFIESKNKFFFSSKYFKNNNKLLIFIGSGFKTKGLDRAIIAFSSLPLKIRNNFNFAIFGKDNEKKYRKIIARYGLEDSINIFPGHDNVPQLMREAAALIHPARYENTGLILIEALSQNLPIITTDNCGYSSYVENDKKSIVLNSPFSQQELNFYLEKLLSKNNYLNKINAKYKQYISYQLDKKILTNI